MSVEDTLGALVDQHLLIHLENAAGEPRLGMLETIREFALECLASSGETERIRRAHAEYFARLAQTAEPVLTSGKRQPWLLRLDAEQANIRVALECALRTTRRTMVFKSLGLSGCGAGSHFREARRWVEELRVLPSAAAHTIARANSLNAAAIAEQHGFGVADAATWCCVQSPYAMAI